MKQIKAKCHTCDTVGYIPEDYQGKIRCPNCKSVFKRTAPPLSVIRSQFLKKLEEIEQQGYKKVSWLGGDQQSCEKCKKRNGKVFTIGKMKEILHTHFCDSDHFYQTCRCCILIHFEKTTQNKNPKFQAFTNIKIIRD